VSVLVASFELVLLCRVTESWLGEAEEDDARMRRERRAIPGE
jgi:hypothetical protein